MSVFGRVFGLLLGIWSERGGETKYRDCWNCTYLMALLAAGFDLSSLIDTKCPACARLSRPAAILGPLYGVSIREHFEDNDGLTEANQEQGGTWTMAEVAAKALGLPLLHAAPLSQLPTLLRTPGTVLALMGQGAGLPGGCTVPHANTFVVADDGTLWDFDPLSGNATTPDALAQPVTADPTKIYAWATRLTADAVRYARIDEFQEAAMATVTPVAPGEEIAAGAGGVNVRSVPDEFVTAGTKIGVVPAAARIGALTGTVPSARYGATSPWFEVTLACGQAALDGKRAYVQSSVTVRRKAPADVSLAQLQSQLGTAQAALAVANQHLAQARAARAKEEQDEALVEADQAAVDAALKV